MVKAPITSFQQNRPTNCPSPSSSLKRPPPSRKTTPIRKGHLRKSAVGLIRLSHPTRAASQGTPLKEAVLDETWRDRLQCPVCLDLMLMPTLTPCGHAFCRRCLEQSLTVKQRCCVCRVKLTFDELQPSQVLQRMVSQVRQCLNAQELQTFRIRQQENVEWLDKRKPKEHKFIGKKLDFYHEERWQEGQVTRLSPSLGVKSTINVQQQLYFDDNSLLLAPFGYFTTSEQGRSRSSSSNALVQAIDLQDLYYLNELIRPHNLIRLERRLNGDGIREVRLTFHENIERHSEQHEE